jgi:hypothetical protein
MPKPSRAHRESDARYKARLAAWERRECRQENERLRTFVREIVAIDPKCGGGEGRYFITGDVIVRARALLNN